MSVAARWAKPIQLRRVLSRRSAILPQQAREQGLNVVAPGVDRHTDERQAIEVDVAIHVVNRMLELGRRNSVRIA